MAKIKLLILIGLLSIIFSCSDDTNDSPTVDTSDTTGMYFPEIGNNTWNSVTPSYLNWDQAKLDELKSYLQTKKTKGFIILQNGRIVMEEYFNGHNQNSNWPWYSAAKSLTSVMVGIAQHEDYLHLDSMTSTYLGNNWSSLSQDKQDLITLKHHITMSTGMKNRVTNFNDWTCTAPSCFTYDSDAGTKWDYYQGAFTLTQNIITSATGLNFKQYCKQKVQDKIGLNGNWTKLLDVNIFNSNTRGLAKFGLLALNEGVWDEDTIYPKGYHDAMIESSQNMNKAYGYLWWLNGKPDFLGTADQTIVNGPLIPNAPSDMFCALGAQDLKIYVIPSKNMVIVRSGEPAGNSEFASSSFDNELWGKLNEIFP